LAAAAQECHRFKQHMVLFDQVFFDIQICGYTEEQNGQDQADYQRCFKILLLLASDLALWRSL